jgi:hypothetical protein
VTAYSMWLPYAPKVEIEERLLILRYGKTTSIPTPRPASLGSSS